MEQIDPPLFHFNIDYNLTLVQCLSNYNLYIFLHSLSPLPVCAVLIQTAVLAISSKIEFHRAMSVISGTRFTME